VTLRSALPLPLLVSAALLAPAIPALALDAVPESFAQKVEQGWLPLSCARTGNPEAPRPLTRQWVQARAGERVHVLFLVPSPGFPGGYQFEAQALARSFDLDADIVPLVDSQRPERQDADAMNCCATSSGRAATMPSR